MWPSARNLDRRQFWAALRAKLPFPFGSWRLSAFAPQELFLSPSEAESDETMKKERCANADIKLRTIDFLLWKWIRVWPNRQPLSHWILFSPPPKMLATPQLWFSPLPDSTSLGWALRWSSIDVSPFSPRLSAVVSALSRFPKTIDATSYGAAAVGRPFHKELPPSPSASAYVPEQMNIGCTNRCEHF